MNNILIITFFLLSQVCFAQEAFISSWKTNNIWFQSSDSNQIAIPTVSIGYNYDYAIDWGDGNTDLNVNGTITHTYDTVGTYTLKITGTFPGVYFSYLGEKKKILTIDQWGTGQWSSMGGAFHGCSNLAVNAVDIPDLSNVTNMAFMFADVTDFNGDMGDWDVSNVTRMEYMFAGSTNFNQDIGDWDVSNVTNMVGMFGGAQSFNQDIGNWDVSSVTNMSSMFGAAYNFNQEIGNWDVGNVVRMDYMFSRANSFNQNLGNWDLSNVYSLVGMFQYADDFNGAIGSWDVSNVINMNVMFFAAFNFNQDIGDWDVGKVGDMQKMFALASAFNQDIGDWDVRKVRTMQAMFADATNFNQNIGNWNIGYARSISSMFWNATNFNQDIGNWNVRNISNFASMFRNASSFNQDLSNWDLDDAQVMYAMFKNAISFDQDIGDWDVSGIIDMRDMFEGVTLSSSNYDNLFIGWYDQSLKDNIRFHGGNSQYCSEIAQYARYRMRIDHNWTLIDEGRDLDCIEPIGIEENTFDFFTISPIPANSHLNISIQEKQNGVLVLLDLKGRIYAQLDIVHDKESYIIDVSDYAPGMYIAELYLQNKKLSRAKFLIY